MSAENTNTESAIPEYKLYLIDRVAQNFNITDVRAKVRERRRLIEQGKLDPNAPFIYSIQEKPKTNYLSKLKYLALALVPTIAIAYFSYEHLFNKKPNLENLINEPQITKNVEAHLNSVADITPKQSAVQNLAEEKPEVQPVPQDKPPTFIPYTGDLVDLAYDVVIIKRPHGGYFEEKGCISTGAIFYDKSGREMISEVDLVSAIDDILAKNISRKFPGVKVIFLRDYDKYLSPKEAGSELTKLIRNLSRDSFYFPELNAVISKDFYELKGNQYVLKENGKGAGKFADIRDKIIELIVEKEFVKLLTNNGVYRYLVGDELYIRDNGNVEKYSQYTDRKKQEIRQMVKSEKNQEIETKLQSFLNNTHEQVAGRYILKDGYLTQDATSLEKILVLEMPHFNSAARITYNHIKNAYNIRDKEQSSKKLKQYCKKYGLRTGSRESMRLKLLNYVNIISNLSEEEVNKYLHSDLERVYSRLGISTKVRDKGVIREMTDNELRGRLRWMIPNRGTFFLYPTNEVNPTDEIELAMYIGKELQRIGLKRDKRGIVNRSTDVRGRNNFISSMQMPTSVYQEPTMLLLEALNIQNKTDREFAEKFIEQPEIFANAVVKGLYEYSKQKTRNIVQSSSRSINNYSRNQKR